MNNPPLKSAVLVAVLALIVVRVSLYALTLSPAPTETPRPTSSELSSTTAAVAGLFPTLAATSVRTTITWTPTSVSEILSPGESKTVSIILTSTKNIAQVSVRVSPQLQSIVKVQPQFLERVRKGVPRTITLTIAPAGNAALGTSTGTIQLRKEKKDNTDRGEGDEEPGKLLLKTLHVTVNVWQTFVEDKVGVQLKIPPDSFAIAKSDNGLILQRRGPQGYSIEVDRRSNPSSLALADWVITVYFEGFGRTLQELPNGSLRSRERIVNADSISLSGRTVIRSVLQNEGGETLLFFATGVDQQNIYVLSFFNPVANSQLEQFDDQQKAEILEIMRSFVPLG